MLIQKIWRLKLSGWSDRNKFFGKTKQISNFSDSPGSWNHPRFSVEEFVSLGKLQGRNGDHGWSSWIVFNVKFDCTNNHGTFGDDSSDFFPDFPWTTKMEWRSQLEGECLLQYWAQFNLGLNLILGSIWSWNQFDLWLNLILESIWSWAELDLELNLILGLIQYVA